MSEREDEKSVCLCVGVPLLVKGFDGDMSYGTPVVNLRPAALVEGDKRRLRRYGWPRGINNDVG
jgi:hypothetical protein